MKESTARVGDEGKGALPTLPNCRDSQHLIERDLGLVTGSISDVSRQAHTIAETTAQTSGNVPAVTAGAEEFLAPIGELIRHAGEAVVRSGEAGAIVSGLTASADKIGEAIGVIHPFVCKTLPPPRQGL